MTDSLTHSSTCPACGAPVTLPPDTDGFRCEFCHSVFYPGVDDDGVLVSSEPDPGGLACPICSLPLVKAGIGKIAVLFCGQCHGILLPMPALESAVDEIRGSVQRPAVQIPPDRGELKRAIRCPKCSRRMDTHFYAGPGNVVVDSCDNCLHVWFDHGELTRIARAPDQDAVEKLTWS